MKSTTELPEESKTPVNSQDADISNVSNPFKVYTYSFFDSSKDFKSKHWAKDLTMVIEKDGVKMKLEEKELIELVASLPRTFGGSY